MEKDNIKASRESLDELVYVNEECEYELAKTPDELLKDAISILQSVKGSYKPIPRKDLPVIKY
jgi:hypothetical protein